MKHLLLCITVLCLFILGNTPAHAARHRKIIKTETTITAVSNTSISLKSGGATHTYKISSKTTIYLDGMKVGASDLKKGMHGSFTESGQAARDEGRRE